MGKRRLRVRCCVLVLGVLASGRFVLAAGFWVRVLLGGAFLAIVTDKEYRRDNKFLGSRSPRVIHPMRASSPYVRSGLVGVLSPTMS